MTTSPDTAEEDRHIATGDLAAARRVLEARMRHVPGDVGGWLKLAGLYRALRDPAQALAAVTTALTHAPLDFTALLLRARLLEDQRAPGVGEAYGAALANLPEGVLPDSVAKAVEHGRAVHESYQQTLVARLQDCLPPLSADARERAARLCSNVANLTRVYHCEPSHYHFPGLAEREYHPRSLFPWLARLEAATDVIAGELAAVMSAERAELVPYVQYGADLPLGQWKALNHSRDWTAIHLIQRGRRIEANARHCPQTMALLADIGQPDIPGMSANAMFSLLAPSTTIPPHTGVANTRLLCHLPLIVPGKCSFRVGATWRDWERGTAWVFDDTIEHEAVNHTDQLRVILIFDIWHPDMTEEDKAAVAAVVAAAARPVDVAL